MTALEITYVAVAIAALGLVFSFVIGSREGTLRRYRAWGGLWVILMAVLVLAPIFATFTGQIR